MNTYQKIVLYLTLCTNIEIQYNNSKIFFSLKLVAICFKANLLIFILYSESGRQ